MKTYRIYLDRTKANDYTKGEIDGIIKTLAEDSERVDPWFILNDDADPMKRIDVSREHFGVIMSSIEKIRPDVIRRIDFE